MKVPLVSQSAKSFRSPALEESDSSFVFDQEAYMSLMSTKPWAQSPHWFRECRISALAAMKMSKHCCAGGNKEVMGLLTGRPHPSGSMIVLDSFSLPVEGTETRVNPQEEAYEYITVYLEYLTKVGLLENAVGWYHSHPGYGCWLSGIDVTTQVTSQKFQDPWIAIVVDPLRTVETSSLDIGAFRTYPEGYRISSSSADDKLSDYGAHSDKYYSLNISYFASANDIQILNMLNSRQWMDGIRSGIEITSRCNCIANDICTEIQRSSDRLGGQPFNTRDNRDKTLIDKSMKQLSTDANEITNEMERMLHEIQMKEKLFGSSL